MRYYFLLLFALVQLTAKAQVISKFDSTLKIGKTGFRVLCFNKSPEKNMLNLRPIGFKNEAREVSFEIKGRVLGAEIDDLNMDGFPDMVVFAQEPSEKKYIIAISSRENESYVPIYMPDLTNDPTLSKGYRGKDEYKLVEGVLFRKFPIYTEDTANKVPTNKSRQIMYRVNTGEKGMLNFKSFKSFDVAN